MMHSRHLLKLIGLTMLAAVSVMAVSTSAAQAKYLLLLNGVNVDKITVNVEILAGYIKAVNGLKIECTGGVGTAEAKGEKAGSTKVTVSASLSFTGCKWAGNKFCTIKDGTAGLIKASGSGEIMMPGAKEYLVEAISSSFAVIKSEGELCTLPAEEPVSGTCSIVILEADVDSKKTKLAHLKNVSLSLNGSKVTELVGEMHLTDLDANAEWGIFLSGL